MSTAEAKARAGEDLSPADDLKHAIAGFMTEIKSKLQEQDDRMTKLDRKTMFAAKRPALAQATDIEAPHQKAFGAYLRSGDDDGLRGLEIEGKAMSTAVAADGRHLEVFAVNEEHGYLRGDDLDRVKVGDRIAFVPAHVCTVVNLTDQVQVMASDQTIRTTWPVDARGKNQ